MPSQPAIRPALLEVVHEPWAEPLTRPAMARAVDRHARIALTNRYVEVAGRPAIPVSGELHYSRIPRAEWAERLRLMRSGGVTVVAAYVLWNHHEPEQGRPTFEGGLDVAAFVRTAAEAGLDVVLRIGPWCHGEVRNGGFPDWVQEAPVEHRTDDPAYLALVDPWFAALGAQVASLCGPESNVIGIQLENELYDQPGHLVTLKRMARRHGLVAPIYTATAWGGADLPVGEVLPLYGGYGDGFWVDADHDWDTTFREHFFFSHTWDDPGIGADLRAHPGIGRRPETPRLPSASFPAATCELGGGMATAYHRRPLVGGADVAAVAHNKIGNGSGWQGYYMYAGGTNPRPALQESHATGYPNDLPEFDYDFHAPIGAAGRLSDGHAALRRQHAFLAAFGDRLAPMPSTLPSNHPTSVDDTETLRWAIRSDGASGWLFITWQQPHVPLPTIRDAQFAVTLDDGERMLPHRPVDVAPGTIAHWPLNLEVGGVRLDWATASPLTVLDGGEARVGADGAVPTLVLVAEAGIPVELATIATVLSASDASADAPRDAPSPAFVTYPAPDVIVVDAEQPRLLELRQGQGRLRVLVLPAASADQVWVLDASGRRRLVLCADPVFEDERGRLAVRASAAPDVLEYSTGIGCLEPVAVAIESADSSKPVGRVASVAVGEPTPGTPPPASYGERHGRASAPSRDEVARHGTSWTFALPASSGARRTLEVDWAGDVARLEVDGVVVADRFWDGTPWTIGLDALDLADDAQLTLRIVPLHPDAAVHLPEVAAARRALVDDPLLALDGVTVVEAPLWTELPPVE
ncbi:beta-galactosidase [Agromyces sp. CFH 90414]|uniref:Beta-galactosidase n=1 Tax=Agromyces agglutinans TaxID=2662258 RepID=A0A6I2FDQ5_9MICO|nr:beta-galactosidase [Agromyces agglutinans]MRG60013.1 beta-galactosidase [Agromyces agglutinans]